MTVTAKGSGVKHDSVFDDVTNSGLDGRLLLIETFDFEQMIINTCRLERKVRRLEWVASITAGMAFTALLLLAVLP